MSHTLQCIGSKNILNKRKNTKKNPRKIEPHTEKTYKSYMGDIYIDSKNSFKGTDLFCLLVVWLLLNNNKYLKTGRVQFITENT